MQGKEASAIEPAAKCTAGIDVGQDWLDVHVLPQEKKLRAPNTSEGVRQIKRFLNRFDVALTVVEATGKWHRLTVRNLAASGLPVAQTDPYRVRMFARAQGLFAKNDRLDARVLAQFAAVMTPVSRPLTPVALEGLQEIVTARSSAVGMLTALKNQKSAAQDGFLKGDLRRRIFVLIKDIKRIEHEIRSRIDKEPEFQRRFGILTSIKGVGPITAMTLVACLSELGATSARAIAKLAGLAPHDDDSGKRHGPRTIWGGRSPVRRALYLSAFTAVRCNPQFKAFFSRLTARGLPFKAAVIAAARKLAVLANTLIAQNRTWSPEPPKPA